jgi:hypothetical protein
MELGAEVSEESSIGFTCLYAVYIISYVIIVMLVSWLCRFLRVHLDLRFQKVQFKKRLNCNHSFCLRNRNVKRILK